MRLLPLLATFLFVAACEGPPGPPGRTLELKPDDDTYVVSGEETETNPHVDDLALIVGPDNGLAPSHAFMKWELVKFTDIAAAHLYYEVKVQTGVGPLIVGLYGTDADGWDGDAMTWSGQPGPIFLLSSASVPATNETLFVFDATDYLVEQIAQGPITNEDTTEGTFAFAMISTNGSVSISSAEEPDHAPHLLVLPL